VPCFVLHSWHSATLRNKRRDFRGFPSPSRRIGQDNIRAAPFLLPTASPWPATRVLVTSEMN
jgi:hypothetical protein